MASDSAPSMLSQKNLSQLQGLKSQMEAAKERAEAVVKGTQARYGFAVLDDGREIFIPPQEMLKVFPDDRVKVCIRAMKDNRTIADIEKLVASPLTDFTGRCVCKGKAMFVEPDLPRINRWLFIPPQARNGVREGDYVRCAILRHPIKDGKPQARVLAVLGNAATPGIENLYCAAKYRLADQWSQDSREDLKRCLVAVDPGNSPRRRDLTDFEFISIDTARAQEIDDALYAEIRDDGWTLYVAVADPTLYIQMGSNLQREVAARGTSVYFHGHVIPMLPEELSQDACTLAEGVDRPALVCRIAVSDDGEVGEFEFFEATIRSRAKLSYYAVDQYLNGLFDELMSHATPLESLYQVFRALRSRRERDNLVMDDRQEFRWVLGEDKQIEFIEPTEKLLSQKLVEECMVATNRCAARFLAEHEAAGPFISHPGFRSDRLEELHKFLEKHAPDLVDLDPCTITGYRDIMRGLATPERALPLRPMVNRLLTRARMTAKPAPHMGMALGTYTNCTSPLRKYADFLVHLQLKSILGGEEAPPAIDQGVLDTLQETLAAGRAAILEAERWLAGNYLSRLSGGKEIVFRGTITHVTSSGFMVRLTDSGLTGFVDLRKDPEKFSYDKWMANLTSTTRRFSLEQAVELRFLEVDAENQHQALFAPLPNCGLKQALEPTAGEQVDSLKPAREG